MSNDVLIIIVGFMLLTMLLLTGCDDNDGRPYYPPVIKETNIQGYKLVKIDDLECLKYSSGHNGGLSCNWEKYNAKTH
jgi:hypothetical protein